MLGTSKEGLLSSFISRVSQGPPVTKWTSSFTKAVERVNKSAPDRAGPLLVQMEEWLLPSKFENVCHQAQVDLLTLWESALRLSSERHVQQVHKEVALGLIVLIIQRDDFSLREEISPDCRALYNTLLLATFDRATQLLKFNSKAVGEVQFAATALAVFFFRMPLVSTMVVDAFQVKPKEMRNERGFWVPDKPLTTPQKQESDYAGGGRGGGRRREGSSSSSLPRTSRLSEGEEGDATMMTSPPAKLSDSFQSTLSLSDSTSGSQRKSKLSQRLAEKKAIVQGEEIPPLTPKKTSAPSSEGKPSVTAITPASASSLKRTVDEFNDLDKRFVDSNPDLFLWNASLQDSDHTTKVFNHVLDATPHWTKWLANKESFFLSFVEMFVAHVQRCCAHYLQLNPAEHNQIRWRSVPGYLLILNCFFPLLRSAIWWDSIARRTAGQGAGWVTSLQGYMRVKRTATSLLQADRSLLPAFVRCAFECTNLNSLLSVDSGIEHLNLFFATSAVVVKPSAEAYTAAPRGIATTSSSKNESLPDSFDYDSFWECFEKIVESESYQVLLKCCSFLYNNLHLFFGKNRTRIVNDLLCPKVFFRLFLHWSPEVRTCFHHLIVYKILRADRRFLPCFSDSQVMLLYGTNSSTLNGKSSSSKGGSRKTPVTSPRVAVSAKAAWGKQDMGEGNSVDGVVMPAPAVPIQPLSPTNGYPQPPSQPREPHGSGGGSTPDVLPATADEIAQLTRSAQRRLSLFDRANAVDDEELWSDMAFSSKIDSFVRMCLSFRDKDGGGVPRNLLPYVEPALEQYSLLLIRYYRGATLASLDDIPDTLSHRMMLSEFIGT